MKPPHDKICEERAASLKEVIEASLGRYPDVHAGKLEQYIGLRTCQAGTGILKEQEG